MKGLKSATKKLKDRELREWIKERKEKHRDNQIALMDALTPYFISLQYSLPPQLGKIVFTLANFYGEAIKISKLSQECKLPYNVLTSQLCKLRQSGIVAHNTSGYSIKNPDFLRFHAVRYDSRWREWESQHPTEDLSNIIDR